MVIEHDFTLNAIRVGNGVEGFRCFADYIEMNGDVYAAMYGTEPDFGTGVKHTLAENEAATKTVTLKWNADANDGKGKSSTKLCRIPYRSVRLGASGAESFFSH